MELGASSTVLGSRSVNPADRNPNAGSNDYQTFLKMMTTQMQNQDPLNPMDSAEFAVQLATFSSVEQQTRTNELLATMQSQFGMMGMAQMAGWVGSEARAEMPARVTAGATLDLAPNPLIQADRVVMVVKDEDGTVVNRVDLPADTTQLDWTPVDVTGAPLPDGIYSFLLENYEGETKLTDSPVETWSRIKEVRGGANGMTLVLENEAEVSVASVTALRE
ncbi:flagellar hook capping FlgD N-terminal domain-containing protein [Gemmobacter denitrificans]|uniref:Basal-body rod modification protein FlgD n=1 Tax=Gemmobacter denitrificans TaxID=3123040 RepID=A0ABU8BVC3_9RHOB